MRIGMAFNMPQIYRCITQSSAMLCNLRVPRLQCFASYILTCFATLAREHIQPVTGNHHQGVGGASFAGSLYRYLSMNSSWNFTIDPTHSVPGARNVVRKCKVPSFCPNPLPATTHTPVASSNRML